MGEIRDKILERNAMDGMEKNAHIKELSVGLNFLLSIVGKFGGSSTPPHYSRKSTYWKIDKDTAEELIDMEDRENWVNDNRQEYEHPSFERYKDISSTIRLEAVIVCEFEYFTGGTVTGTRKIKLDSANCYSPVADVGSDGNVKIAEELEDKLIIEVADKKVEYERGRDVAEYDSSDIMTEYLGVNSSTIEGRFSVEELDDSLSISINSGSSEYEKMFKPPFDDDNKVWKLTEEFGYQNPFLLNSESCQISFNGVVDDSWPRLDYVRVNEENKSVGTTKKLEDRLSKFVSRILSN